MKDVEIVVFNDKSWVRFTEYQKLQEDFELFKKGKVCDLCNYNTVGQDEYIDALEEQIKELKAQIKVLEDKDFEKCPFRYSDMGCDYCDYRDRDLKEEYENELQEEAQRHEQRMFDLQCQNYDFDYGDVKY